MKFYIDKNSILKLGLMLLVTGLFCTHLSAQNQTPIALNQIGFFPNASKVAIVSDKTTGTFSVQTAAGKVVFTGKLKPSWQPDFSGIKTASADFSALQQNGNFVVSVEGLPKFYLFKLLHEVLLDLRYPLTILLKTAAHLKSVLRKVVLGYFFYRCFFGIFIRQTTLYISSKRSTCCSLQMLLLST